MVFTVILNQKEHILDIPCENYTIKDLLEDLDSKNNVFTINNQILIAETLIKDGDIIKII